MYSIRLNDGSLRACNWCGEADGILVVDMDCSVIEAIGLLTAHQFDNVAFLYGEQETVYSGYTQAVGMNAHGEHTSISLKRGETDV